MFGQIGLTALSFDPFFLEFILHMEFVGHGTHSGLKRLRRAAMLFDRLGWSFYQ
jgi:hypothetical protein